MNRLWPLFLLLAALYLVGCSGAPSWMEGDWTFDMDRTQQELATETPAATSSSNPTNFAGLSASFMNGATAQAMGGLKLMLAKMIIPQLEGMQLTITSKDIITTVQGQGKALSYEIVHKSSTECTIKESDGTVTTYYRAGNEIYSFGTGGISNVKFYMKRKG